MRTFLGIAALAGLLVALAAPALAQTAPPDKVAVPNSSTQVKCNPNGTAEVTNGPNAETSTTNNVPGTPVTSSNPNGSGTTSSETPTLAKPANANVQCAKTEPQQPAAQQNAAPAMPANSTPEMDALTNNPNGDNWLQKFNRPTVATAHKTKHHAKRATGGGH